MAIPICRDFAAPIDGSGRVHDTLSKRNLVRDTSFGDVSFSAVAAWTASGGNRHRQRRNVEDVDEPVEELGFAVDPDASALDRLARVERAGQQRVQALAGLEDEVGSGSGPFVDLELAAVDARVDDDLADAKLVAARSSRAASGRNVERGARGRACRGRDDVVRAAARGSDRAPQRPSRSTIVLELAAVLGQLVADSRSPAAAARAGARPRPPRAPSAAPRGR